MQRKIFISHNSGDEPTAKILATALSRITLNQITTWFSSDKTPSGGIQPGAVWLDDIREKLLESKAVVVLLTPSSIKKPWILFESGFGAANKNCDVISVCIGIALDKVPFPLAMYQTFQLSDYASLSKFFSKILNRYKITYDEEMSKPVLKETISSLIKAVPLNKENENKEVSVKEAVEDIKQHIDRKLVGFISSQNDSPVELYSVPLFINFPNLKSNQSIEIESSTTVQNVLDSIFFMLDDIVKPYTYLEKWVLTERKVGVKLIIREVAYKVPASFIFTPSSKWEANPLDTPYSAPDSSSLIKRFRGDY